MPIVHIEILAGRSADEKSQVAQRVTEAVCATLNARPEAVRVLVTEYGEGQWFVAGRPLPLPKAVP